MTLLKLCEQKIRNRTVTDKEIEYVQLWTGTTDFEIDLGRDALEEFNYNKWRVKECLDARNEITENIDIDIITALSLIELISKQNSASVTRPATISNDPIDPAHYNQFKIEPIVFINGNDLNFNRGNVIKYVCRAGLKGDAIEDLNKAKQYIDFEIRRLTE